MWFASFLRNRNGSGPGVRGHAHKITRKRAASRLRLEALEDRWLPSTLTVLDSIFSSNRPDNIFGPYADGGGNTFK